LIEEVKIDKNLTVYKVKLNINGKWKYVLLDNFFPNVCNDGKEMFCFGSSFKKELWVSIFEKAWAKINGCYARIGYGGYCRDAFDILTD
jgi:calpain-15